MRKIFIAIACFALIICLTACNKDIIIDWAPVTLSGYITDSEGHDLLNEKNEGYIGNDLKLTYNGVDYPLTIETKAYAPDFYGFVKRHNDTGYYFIFGELDGSVNYDDDFVLSWGDRSVTFHLKRKVNNLTTSLKEKWTLNGEKVTLPCIIKLSDD